MSAEAPQSDLDARANRRVWWGLAGVVALLLGIAAGFYLFYDIPPPDPATYHYDFKPVPPGENAIEVFERETETLRKSVQDDWNKRIQEDERLLKFEPGCEASLRAHVEAHRELLEKFQRFVREAPRPLAYPGLNANTDLFTPISFSPLQDSANLLRRQLMLEALTGATTETCHQALELVAFAKELSGLDSTLLHWLVMMTLQAQGLTGLQKALLASELTPAEALDLAGRLKAAELASSDLGRCFRVESHVSANTFAKWRQNTAAVNQAMASDEYSWFGEQMIKPNMSVVENLEILAPFMRALDAGWDNGMDAANDLDRISQAMTNRKSWRTWVHPNLIGRTLLATSLGSYRMITHKSVQTVILNRCLQTALALHAFELEKGRLPERLEELVPAYLPAVPEDPVTGGPLKWNPHTARLYSIGEDEHDGGGDFDPERFRIGDKDWGIVYPWKPLEKSAP